MNGEPSGWAVGWTAFAGFMMVLLGFWWIIAGLVAVINDSFFGVTQEWIFEFSTTTWGWIHLVLGIIILFSGFGLFSGNVMARTVGVIIGVAYGLRVSGASAPIAASSSGTRKVQ